MHLDVASHLFSLFPPFRHQPVKQEEADDDNNAMDVDNDGAPPKATGKRKPASPAKVCHFLDDAMIMMIMVMAMWLLNTYSIYVYRSV